MSVFLCVSWETGVWKHLRVSEHENPCQPWQGASEQVTECLFPCPPLQLIVGVQELIWGCVCEHCLVWLSWAGYQTRRRSLFLPTKEKGSCCCQRNWSCWSSWVAGGGCLSWRKTSRSCPVRGNLLRRSSCHLWCWLHCRGWASTGPQTHWPGHCHLSTHSCSCCHWKNAGHSGDLWASSNKSPWRGWSCCHSSYLKTLWRPCWSKLQEVKTFETGSSSVAFTVCLCLWGTPSSELSEVYTWIHITSFKLCERKHCGLTAEQTLTSHQAFFLWCERLQLHQLVT